MPKRTQFTHPWLSRDSWILWEWWVLATVMGGFVGIGLVGLVSAIASNLGTVNAIVLLHLVGALEGAAFGFAQWLVLRRYIKRIGWWIVATTLGAISAWLIGLKVSVMLTLIFFDGTLPETIPAALLKAVFWLGVWIGGILGCAQWLVLKAHVRRGIWWVFANALAWGLGLLVALAGVTLVKPGEYTVETLLIGVATGATAGVVIGAITGIALVWLLKPRLLRHH